MERTKVKEITQVTHNDKTYKTLNDVFYNIETQDKVIKILESARKNRQSVIIRYGDTDTGKCWMDEHDIEGFIGRSTGTVKIPLLVPKGEIGGGGILDHCIVKIVTEKGSTLYEHPTYNRPKITVNEIDEHKLKFSGHLDGELVARFSNVNELNQWLRIMSV